MSSIQPLAFLTCVINVNDAEAFIRNAMESDVRGKNNITVIIKPDTQAFELFPCLVAAQDAYRCGTNFDNPKLLAIKALREATKARNMELSIGDAQAVVEAFICE